MVSLLTPVEQFVSSTVLHRILQAALREYESMATTIVCFFRRLIIGSTASYGLKVKKRNRSVVLGDSFL